MTITSFALIFAGIATLTSALSHNAILNADNNYHLAWDFDEENIMFEVTVKTRGYIGLGFSPNGGMAGSDIVIGWVDDSTGKGEISDRHAVSQSAPLVDKRQDYILLSGSQNDTHTVLKFRRKVELFGEEDHNIKDETVRVIWAYHEADPTPEGSIQYHGAKRGSKSIYLLNPQRQLPVIPDNVIYEEFLNPNVTIPTDHTTYWCQAFTLPELDRKHHMIKYEPVIEPGHESEVHHILLYGCYHPVSNETINKGHKCYYPNMPRDFWGCTSVIISWAVGGESVYFPEHVGLPLGYEGDPTMFLMETHYDNPTGKEGLVDSSGFRITLTPDLRKYEVGILETGEAVTGRQIIPPFSESFRTSGYCFPQCLSQAMESQPQGIKVIGVGLHSHLLGHAMRVRHFRNGIEQPILIQDNNYDFNYQSGRLLRNEVEILPGDHLVTECDYRSIGRKEVTYGGLSTREEMCLSFIAYYPRIKLSNCESSPVTQYQATFLNVSVNKSRTITSPGRYAGKDFYKVFHTEVDWSNKTMRDKYQALIEQEGVDGFKVRCNQGRLKYPVNGQVMSLPETKFSAREPSLPGRTFTTTTTSTSGSFRVTVTSHFHLLILFAVMMTYFR